MEAIAPHIETLCQTDTYGKFLVEPLERGFGTTIGNSLRRVLLSSIPGAAITSVKIEGVLHEFSTIPGVKEDTTELLLNLKDLHIKVHHDGSSKPEPKTIWIDVKGAGEVTGADIRTPADVEIVNPELHLATISDESASLSMEMTVEIGKGYVLPEKHERIKPTIGVIPVGAAFTPVRKVNFIVEPTRVGHRTDYERLILEIWTTGAISPTDALSESARILERHIRLFADLGGGAGIESFEMQGLVGDETQLAAKDARIEELDFSVRTYNCLKKANILTIGELVQISEQDLMGIRNFGKKSLAEVKEKLAQMGLSLKRIGGEPAAEEIESGEKKEESQ
ncbi:MAG: DNA-directed RNA polymerase subunit alpha [Armatimonadota bacterium]|nr:DNA-directed RNA polymerase subunit alpha [Armatimonadota bacterium]